MVKIRHTEYYQMQNVFDNLYSDSKNKNPFNNLMDIIQSEENIKLAFRTIKTNTGSNTCGTDGLTIKDVKNVDIESYVEKVREKLKLYKPDKVRRVYIEKENGDKRPLGIPTIIDRLVQQCIKQVLEPICEARFYQHSYGFRANRSTHHAIARLNYLVNLSHFHYVVDIDIKGFFDNVNHNKLIKQMWSLGIRDRKLIAIIRAMLKAPIEGEGVPTKGTPQGGILSPLLSNIVLNELDWWISSQWENVKTEFPYKTSSSKYEALRKRSNLKEVFIVRYADDFKLVCKNHDDAVKMYHAVKDFINTRFKLEINENKSKIVNLKKSSSEFLGLRFKLKSKGTAKSGFVLQSNIRKKKIEKIENSLKDCIKELSQEATAKKVMLLNSKILGIHEYFKVATFANIDFQKITFSVNRYMYNRLRNVAVYELPKNKNELYNKKYGGSKAKTWIIEGVPIFPIHYIQHSSAMNIDQEVCKYTSKGRDKILKVNSRATNWLAIELAKRPIQDMSVQYNDNRISRASMTDGKCEVTGMQLCVEDTHCHHRIPRKHEGTDEFDNLRIVHDEIHILIHATKTETINKYLHLIKNRKALKKVK